MHAHDLKPDLGRRRLAGVRWGAAAVFVIFGAGKFVNYASELASFRLYGLPDPDVFTYAVGALELLGGLLLAARRLVDAAHTDLTRLLTGHRDRLDHLTRALFAAETLEAIDAYAGTGVGPGTAPA